VVLNDADPSNSFITKGGVPDAKMVKAFLWDLDGYPMHFIMHTAHAAEIIGYKHPHKKHRDWWLKFYKKVVVGLHLNPEAEEQLDVRLGHTDVELPRLEKVLQSETKWDAGTGTSHGGRGRSWGGSS
jgi:hypothetical protein